MFGFCDSCEQGINCEPETVTDLLLCACSTFPSGDSLPPELLLRPHRCLWRAPYRAGLERWPSAFEYR